MTFEREGFTPEKQKNIYPETLDELSQEVFTLLNDIFTAMRERDLPKSQDDEKLQKSVRLISSDTIKLFKNPQAKTYMTDDWKTGLDLLREVRNKQQETVFLKLRPVEEMQIESKEARQKEFYERFRKLDERISKVISDKAFQVFLRNLQRDYMKALTSNDPEKETMAWRALKGLEKLNEEGLKKLEELLKNIRNESE